MELTTLNAQAREITSKSALNSLRAEGQIPAVIYGRGAEPVLLSVNTPDFRKVYGPGQRNTLLNVVVDGSEYSVVVYEVQKDVITQNVIHIDFKLVKEDEPVKVSVPVVLDGIPEGVRTQGGSLFQQTKVIRVACLPTQIPESYTIDINQYDAGFSFYLKNLDLGNAALVSSDRAVLFTVKKGRGAAK